MTKLADAFADYLKQCRLEKGFTKRTMESYGVWTGHFLRWLEANDHPSPDLSAFSTTILRRYLYDMSARSRPRTVRGAFYPLRGAGKFLVETGALEKDPLIGISMPKKDAPIRKMVSDGDIAALLLACEKLCHPRKIALYRMVIATLAYTGARAQELLDIQLDHIAPELTRLTIQSGKGSKTGHLYPCAEWWDAYRAWMAVRECNTTHPYLFSVNRGRRLGLEGMYRMLDETSAIAGIERAPRPHEFRRSLTVRMMAKGASIREISATLRHSQLKTTLEYALELGDEAKAMTTLGSLTGPSRTAPDLPLARVPVEPSLAPAPTPPKPDRAADMRARRTRTASK